MKEFIYEVIIYSILFSSEYFVCYIVDCNCKNGKKIAVFVGSIIAVLLPSFFAGIRAENVGTDVMVYAKPIFEEAKSVTSLSSFMTFSMETEIGYKLLAVISAHFFSSLAGFLFLTEIIIIVPIYITAYKRRKIVNIRITMLVFMVVFYCATFNLMRQSICAALLVLALQFFEEKNRKNTIVLIFIAMLFHRTAIIGIMLYAFSMLADSRLFRKIGNKIILFILISIGIVIIIFNWRNLVIYFMNKNILPQKYEIYVRLFSSAHNQGNIYQTILEANIVECIFRICFALYGIYGMINRSVKVREFNIGIYAYNMIFCALINIITMCFLHTSYGIRITWINEFILLFMLPGEIADYKNKTTVRVMFFWMIIFGYMTAFIYYGWHGIIPLKFNL